MAMGYNQQHFIVLFVGGSIADRKVKQMLLSEFGATLPRGGWVQRFRSCILKVGTFENTRHS